MLPCQQQQQIGCLPNKSFESKIEANCIANQSILTHQPNSISDSQLNLREAVNLVDQFSFEDRTSNDCIKQMNESTTKTTSTTTTCNDNNNDINRLSSSSEVKITTQNSVQLWPLPSALCPNLNHERARAPSDMAETRNDVRRKNVYVNQYADDNLLLKSGPIISSSNMMITGVDHVAGVGDALAGCLSGLDNNSTDSSMPIPATKKPLASIGDDQSQEAIYSIDERQRAVTSNIIIKETGNEPVYLTKLSNNIITGLPSQKAARQTSFASSSSPCSIPKRTTLASKSHWFDIRTRSVHVVSSDDNESSSDVANDHLLEKNKPDDNKIKSKNNHHQDNNINEDDQNLRKKRLSLTTLALHRRRSFDNHPSIDISFDKSTSASLAHSNVKLNTIQELTPETRGRLSRVIKNLVNLIRWSGENSNKRTLNDHQLKEEVITTSTEAQPSTTSNERHHDKIKEENCNEIQLIDDATERQLEQPDQQASIFKEPIGVVLQTFNNNFDIKLRNDNDGTTTTNIEPEEVEKNVIQIDERVESRLNEDEKFETSISVKNNKTILVQLNSEPKIISVSPNQHDHDCDALRSKPESGNDEKKQNDDSIGVYSRFVSILESAKIYAMLRNTTVGQNRPDEKVENVRYEEIIEGDGMRFQERAQSLVKMVRNCGKNFLTSNSTSTSPRAAAAASAATGATSGTKASASADKKQLSKSGSQAHSSRSSGASDTISGGNNNENYYQASCPAEIFELKITKPNESRLETKERKEKISIDSDLEVDRTREKSYQERDVWAKNIEFLLAVIGFAVDLGNVWRFPYVCYKNGGGAFLIPYTILFVLGGLPIFYMEMSLGQYFSSGCLTIWRRICPIAKGIGYSMCLLNFFTGLYYNTIISWAVFFFRESFTTGNLPWTSCNNSWNLATCRTILERQQLKNLQLNRSEEIVGMSNYTSPTDNYFKREVLQKHRSKGIEDLGDIRKPLATYLAIVFIFIYFAIWKGVKSTGKAVWITALLPYFILIPLLIRGVFLEGAWEGIKYYLSPQWISVTDINVWIEAAKQIYFSLGPGFGTLMALSSYNKFHHNTCKDALIAASVNYFASFISGFVIFSVLGYMSVMSGDDISRVATEGPGLAFEVYPEGLATMQFAALWSAFFFTMVVTLGIDSTFGGLESVITGLCDEYPNSLRRHRGKFIAILIIIIYICSLPTTTYGGNYVIIILENYGTSSLLLIVLFETIVVCWIYGTEKFCSNLEEMHGQKPSLYWRVCWKYISPTILLIIFMGAASQTVGKNHELRDDEYVFPDWVPKVGLLITGSSIICIPAYAIYHFAFKTKGSFIERLKSSFEPGSGEESNGHDEEGGDRSTDEERDCLAVRQQETHIAKASTVHSKSDGHRI